MGNPRKNRSKRNAKTLTRHQDRKFRVIITRDTTESAIIEIKCGDREQARDVALTAGNQLDVRHPLVKVIQKWESDDNCPKKCYLGDPDIPAFGGKRTIKGGSIEEIK
jgi:hypothetical protein